MKTSAGNRLGFIEQDGSSAWRTSGWLLCKLRGNFPPESQPTAAQQARAGAAVAENFCPLKRKKLAAEHPHKRRAVLGE